MGEKIRLVLRRNNMTINDLALKLGTTRQNLTSKLTRDNFSEKDLQEIATIFEGRFEGFFIFEDEKI